jgi:hypothetical protein
MGRVKRLGQLTDHSLLVHGQLGPSRLERRWIGRSVVGRGSDEKPGKEHISLDTHI